MPESTSISPTRFCLPRTFCSSARETSPRDNSISPSLRCLSSSSIWLSASMTSTLRSQMSCTKIKASFIVFWSVVVVNTTSQEV
ncbi:hypothetical protein MBAV_006057 [Candidatus Magnetobacterium bavaricum]|uniref:Uncharacterized protein n=1 Tax=Candidatus Magnetobacterium bavaricum TaxID=29290 RepID=A0A0F3GII2_9BACT|nr:hypothetical protein MBAV_006057 [Candidatus Magnetobacterium bavaricum]